MGNMNMEAELAAAGTEMTIYAKNVSIVNQEDYESAAMVLMSIKNKMKAVKDYWANPKAKAAAAHKEICAKEKEMLSALTEAETIVKKAMQAYVDAEERKRREAEEAERRAREAEAKKFAEQAEKFAADGDAEAAMFGNEMAQAVRDMPVSAAQPIRAAGVVTRKVWKARIVDAAQVPVLFNGLMIRPIDMSAINSIARETKGKAKIDGIEFYEETQIVSR